MAANKLLLRSRKPNITINRPPILPNLNVHSSFRTQVEVRRRVIATSDIVFEPHTFVRRDYFLRQYWLR